MTRDPWLPVASPFAPQAWFEDTAHSVSTMSLRLSHDCAKARGLGIDYLSPLVMLCTCIFVALGIAVFFCWRVSLVRGPAL